MSSLSMASMIIMGKKARRLNMVMRTAQYVVEPLPNHPMLLERRLRLRSMKRKYRNRRLTERP